MRKVQGSILALGVITAFICAAIFLPRPISAGDLEPFAPVGPTMYTLRDIYDRVDSCIGAAVEKTGQSQQYRTHDDGHLEKGVAWPRPRFTDNNDGTVRDNLTGLIWVKNAYCDGPKNWYDAVDYAAALYDGCTSCGGIDNDCGLSDGSTAGDWRLPNVKELLSLIDFGHYDPALPSGHPFTSVQLSLYWSSTTWADDPDIAWFAALSEGIVFPLLSFFPPIPAYKTLIMYVWPVRGGQ